MRIFVVALLGLMSCSCSLSVNSKELAKAVDEQIIPMEDHEFPKVIADAIADKKVLFLAEGRHWVQEQPELMASFLPTLHRKGYRVLLCEYPHADGWIADDYVLGSLNEIPTSLRAFEGLFLDRIREFNASLPMTDRLRVHNIDVNHDVSAFFSAVSYVERQIDAEGVFRDLQISWNGSLHYQVRTNEMIARHLLALEELRSRLNSEKDRLEEKWTPRWYGRVKELVEVEIASARFRNRTSYGRNEQVLREQTMILLADRRIAETPDRVAIIVGAAHAQKEGFMQISGLTSPTSIQWLGEHIRMNYASYHIAIFGAEGQVLLHFTDTKSQEVHVTDRPKADLLRIMAEKSGGKIVLLPLNSEVFGEWTCVDYRRTEPGAQFDAYILYPHMTPLRSLGLLHP